MRGFSRVFTAGVLAWSLAGCVSTLEIGVDVYNGPLVNQDEVQAQQLIGILHGTHMLLTQFTDRFQANHCPECPAFLKMLHDILGTYDKDEFLSAVADVQDPIEDIKNLSRRIGETDEELIDFFKKVAALQESAADVEHDPASLEQTTLMAYNESKIAFFSSIVKDITPADAAEFETRYGDVKKFNDQAKLKKIVLDGREHQTIAHWAQRYSAYFGQEWKKYSPYLHCRLKSFFNALEAIQEHPKKILGEKGAQNYTRLRERALALMDSVLRAKADIYAAYARYDSALKRLKVAFHVLSQEVQERDKANSASHQCVDCQHTHPPDEQLKGWTTKDLVLADAYVRKLPAPYELSKDTSVLWKDAQSRVRVALEALAGLNSVGSPGRGKNPKGLDQLIRQYISAPSGDTRVRRRRELFMELARFGEKLRMMGTYNRGLLQSLKPSTHTVKVVFFFLTGLGDDGFEINVQQLLLFLESIGNQMVASADSVILRERKRVQAMVRAYDAAVALEAEPVMPTKGIPSLKAQIDRLRPSVDAVRRGEVPYELLALWEIVEDDAGLFSLSVRLRMELALHLAEPPKEGDSKVKALKDALRELLDQRADFSDISPARDFLRTVDEGQLKDKKWFEGLDTILMRRMVDVVERQLWRNINTVELSASGKANYVVVKDAIGNWYIKAYSNDPSELIAAAFGGAKAVAQIALSTQTGGTGDALRKYLEDVLSGNGKAGADSELLGRQLEMAWATYEVAKLGELAKAHQAILDAWPAAEREVPAKPKDATKAPEPKPLADAYTQNRDVSMRDPRTLSADERRRAIDATQRQIDALRAALARKDVDGTKEKASKAYADALAANKRSLQAYQGTISAIAAGVTEKK